MKVVKVILSFFAAITIAHAKDQRAVVSVEGMSCVSCATAIEREFKKHSEVKDIDISLSKNQISLSFTEGKSLSRNQIEASVKIVGYKVKRIEGI